jgi:hypothetical protein
MRSGVGRLGACCAAAFTAPLVVAAVSAASSVKLCIPKAEGSATLTPKHGKCKKGYKLTKLDAEGKEGKAGHEGKPGAEGKVGSTGFTTAELETLKSILPHISYVGTGIDGKATIRFSAVNLQVVNGEGKTATRNGEGNLVIGYDEDAGRHGQTGSHDLVLGEEQTFTSYGGIVAGEGSEITAPWASVTGGHFGEALAEYASVSGGEGNVADGIAASVSGGENSTASGGSASVSGGDENSASSGRSSVSGGLNNGASAAFSSVSGGKSDSASGEYSSVSGGTENTAKGKGDSVSGGFDDEAFTGEDAWLGGGLENTATGSFSSVAGGELLVASGRAEAKP